MGKVVELGFIIFRMIWIFGLFEIYGIINKDLQPALGLNYRLVEWGNFFIDANTESRYWKFVSDSGVVSVSDPDGGEIEFHYCVYNRNYIGDLGVKPGISINHTLEISSQIGGAFQYLQGLVNDTIISTRKVFTYSVGVGINIDGLKIINAFVKYPGPIFKYLDIYLDYRAYRMKYFKGLWDLLSKNKTEWISKGDLRFGISIKF